MKKQDARAATVWGLAVAGVLVMCLVGQRYRVDAVGERHDLRPAVPEAIGWGLLYLIGLTLMAVAWLKGTTLRWSLKQVLLGGLALHVLALVTPPFLSLDSLCYAAIGRAMAVFHQTPYQPLVQSLPAGDLFLTTLPPSWQIDTSAYGPAFNELARLVAQVGGDSQLLHLRIYQIVAAACMLGCAALVGVAADDGRDVHAGPRAAALVVLSPMAIIEGTMNGHNDAMLALAAAAYVLLTSRRQLGALPLVVAITVKASGALLAGVELARITLVRMTRRLSVKSVLALGAVGFALLLAVLVGFGHRLGPLEQFARLLGRSDEPIAHCTRSIECLPRAFFHYVLDWKTVSFGIGLVMRWVAGLWLLYAALRAIRSRRPLAWAGAGLFIYYLLLHGYMQSWYLLSLVPLLPFADARMRPATITFTLTALAYYAVHMPFHTATSHAMVAVKEVVEAAAVIFPPVAVLLRRRNMA